MTLRNTLFAALLAVVSANASAQDSSLMLVPSPPAMKAAPRDTATLANSSFIFSPLPPESQQRPLAVNDILRVQVDYRATLQSEGDTETRKQGAFSSVLTDWIGFDGKDIFAAPQTRGDPTVGGTLNSQNRAEADISAREALTFIIASKIVDIRPNGDFVIEGRSRVKVNEEVWMTHLTGTVSRSFVGPDRTVRHTDVVDLRIDKYELGAVRDGYRRGWLSRKYGKYKAF